MVRRAHLLPNDVVGDAFDVWHVNRDEVSGGEGVGQGAHLLHLRWQAPVEKQGNDASTYRGGCEESKKRRGRKGGERSGLDEREERKGRARNVMIC